jgi:hypothetical protein
VFLQLKLHRMSLLQDQGADLQAPMQFLYLVISFLAFSRMHVFWPPLLAIHCGALFLPQRH